MIYFNQVLPETAEKNTLRVKFNLGVAVYGLVGDVTREGTLNAVSIIEGTNPVVARLEVSSAGSAHVRLNGQYAIYPAEAYPGAERTTLLTTDLRMDDPLPESVLVAGYLPARPVLPETRRNVFFRVPRELPPGDYVLDLNGELPGHPIDLAVPFTIPEPRLVAGSETE
jgi:hypothetical protein